jgi:hypothetical protein
MPIEFTKSNHGGYDTYAEIDFNEFYSNGNIKILHNTGALKQLGKVKPEQKFLYSKDGDEYKMVTVKSLKPNFILVDHDNAEEVLNLIPTPTTKPNIRTKMMHLYLTDLGTLDQHVKYIIEKQSGGRKLRTMKKSHRLRKPKNRRITNKISSLSKLHVRRDGKVRSKQR